MTPEIDQYVAKKELIQEAEKEGLILLPRHTNRGVGLVNSGSTCYLNSVIQCLAGLPELANIFVQGTYDDIASVKALKHLLTQLAHSKKNAVKTTNLLDSFGWGANQRHEQHDAHEFYDLLCSSLGGAHAELETELVKVLNGVSEDVIKCSRCCSCSTVTSPFRSLSVDVPEEVEETDGPELSRIPLATLLKNLLNPETLDEENKWDCSQCKEKVCAERRQTFQTLPLVVAIHMKRFRFDVATKKRRKVAVPVEIPVSLDLSSLLSLPAPSPAYSLCGVVVHYGTAMGGHYKALQRSGEGAWWECDDAVKEKLGEETVKELFSDFSPAAPVEGEEAVVKMTRQHVLAENAYMLFYSRNDNNVSPHALPITAEVEKENAFFDELVALNKIKRRIVQCKVKVRHGGRVWAEGKELLFLREQSLSEVTGLVYEAMAKEGLLADFQRENARLCRAAFRGRSEETFGDRSSLSLEKYGFTGGEGFGGESYEVFLDVRTESDAPFKEYSPDDLLLLLRLWEEGTEGGGVQGVPGGEKEEKGHWKEVVVPGKDRATVLNLRQKAEEVFGLQAFSLVCFHATSPVQLLGGSAEGVEEELRKVYGIYPGWHIIVVPGVIDTQSAAFQHLFSVKNTLRVCFNLPSQGAEGEGPVVAYDHELKIDKQKTLADLKDLISSALGLKDTPFHLRRGAGQAQFKEEGGSLDSLGLSDGSIVHVQLGKGCKVGEHLVRFEVELAGEEKSRYILLEEMGVAEKASILSMKKVLHESWATFSQKIATEAPDFPTPESPHHIRLRDLKGGKPAGPLRDERLVSRCLLGLADGRRVLVQVLSQAEKISPDDMMLTLRLASYDKKTFSPPLDLCLPRTLTVQQLYSRLLADHPELNEATDAETEGIVEARVMEVAKGYATGPTLNLKNAYKLKWNDPAVLSAPSAQIDAPPLSLRDGSVLVIRGKADWNRAQQRIKAKKEAEESDLAARPVCVGAGTSVARVRTSHRNRRQKMATSSTEPTLKIAVADARPPLPDETNSKSPSKSVGEGKAASPDENKMQGNVQDQSTLPEPAFL